MKASDAPRRVQGLGGALRARKLTARERGYTTEWDRASRAYRKANPLCRLCEAEDATTLATEVDHIVPHRGDMTLFWDVDNWQPICRHHHALKSAIEDGGAGNPHPTWLPAPACKVVVVSGPPGAGKTTYCNERAGDDDIVVDLDECFRHVSGVHGHDLDDHGPYLNAALRWRNAQLAALASKTTGVAYLIVGAPAASERQWWAETLNADVVLLDPGKAVCEARTTGHRLAAVADWYRRARRPWRAPYSTAVDVETGLPLDPRHPANAGEGVSNLAALRPGTARGSHAQNFVTED